MKQQPLISYPEYKEHYASKCPRCKGTKRVLRDGVPTACGCQHLAAVKWRFEQIELQPPELKYYNWSDFNGSVRTRYSDGRTEVIGCIDGMGETTAAKVAHQARKQALLYCFDTDDMNEISVREKRQKHSLIHEKALGGENVVIAGGHRSGKSLLAALILKEVVRASIDSGKDYTFGWVESSDLVDAAYNFGKHIDFEQLEEWSELNFLVVDNFDVSNTKVSDLDQLFYKRSSYRRPTIVTCSTEFFFGCQDKPMQGVTSGRVKQMLGKEALQFMLDPSNVEIKLCMEGS